MPDSTFPSDRGSSPEQTGDSSTTHTLGRSLLRRYGHAGVLRTAAVRGLARRYQAIGAQATSFTRAIQRRWFPGATSYGQSPSELVFRQGAPAETSQRPVAQGRPLQPMLQQAEPDQGGLAAATVPTVWARPVVSAPVAAAAQRRTAVPPNPLSQNQAEPATAMTAATVLPVVARRQEPDVHPSAQQTSVQPIGGYLRRNSTRLAATAEFGAATIRGQEVASARQLMAHRSEPGVPSVAPAGMTVVAARRTHSAPAAGSELVPTHQAPLSAGFGAATMRGQEVASARQMLARRSEPGVPSVAPAGMTVVAARRPHRTTVPAVGLVPTLQATALAGVGAATMRGQEVAPARQLLARRSEPGVPSVASAGIPVMAALPPRPSRTRGGGQSAGASLYPQAPRSLARQVTPAAGFGAAMLHRLMDAPVSRFARNEDSQAAGVSGNPVVATTSPGGAMVLGRAEIARELSQYGTAKPARKIVVPVQASREPVTRSALPVAGSIGRMSTRSGGWLGDEAGALALLTPSEVIGATEQRPAPGIARTAQATARHSEPLLAATGQVTRQPDLHMPVQSVGGPPVVSREFDVVLPVHLRSQEATDSGLPLARLPVSSAGATQPNVAQRRSATPGSTMFATAEVPSASPGATKDTPASSANGAGRNSRLDEANIEQLADRVIGIIERRITIEAESRGLSLSTY